MRKRLLIMITGAAVAATCWALLSQACENDKQTTAKALNAKGAKVTAVAAGASTMGMNCEGHGVSAMTASSGGGRECCAHKAKGATASMGHDACNSKLMGAGMIGAPSCGMHGTAAITAEMRADCNACADMVTCSTEMSANNVQTQIVPLRNGVMFVYTTDTPAHVRAVQNALARRNDRLNTLAQSGDRAKLCPECKNVRGAIASGKLTRETVNIEGGCMTLVTSTDPAMVAKLRAMATLNQSVGRNKI